MPECVVADLDSESFDCLIVCHAGEEHVYCQALIEAHKACLRVEGFNVSAGQST